MIDGNDVSFRGAAQARRRAESLGEPMQFGLVRGSSAEFLEPFGLSLAAHLGPTELAQRYLRTSQGTIAGEPYGFAAIAHARVTSNRVR